MATVHLAFNTIALEHFKSFDSLQALDFRDLEPGLYFVRGLNEVEPLLGSNGAGKSSLLDALTWCLYGKTASGLKNPDVKSWQGSKPPFVQVSVTCDEESVDISRTTATNGIKVNGAVVGPDRPAEWLGLSFDLFINTVLLAQGAPLFFDRSPKDKMQLFTDVLRLERWEERSAKAAKKVRELEDLEAEMRGELTGAESALARTQQLLIQTQEQSREWEAERKTATASVGKKLKVKQAALADAQERLDKAELAWDQAATELQALRRLEQELSSKARKLGSEEARTAVILEQLAGEEENIEAAIAKLSSAKTCPTCGQVVKSSNLKDHKKELELRLAGACTERDEVQTKALELSKQLKEADKQLRQTTLQMSEFTEKEQAANAKRSLQASQVSDLKVEVATLLSQETLHKDNRNPHIDTIQNLRRQVAQSAITLRELKEDLAKAARQIEHTRFWVKGFKDVQLYIIEEVLQELQLTTNVMLAEVGLDGWRVDYDVERETKSGTVQRGLNVTILSPHNKTPVRYESWSGGEGQRLRIVGALALSEVLLNHAGVDCDLEILDEPTRHLSTEGVADLCAYLSERARRLGKRILLIDHMAHEGSAFAGSILVRKTAKGSVIEQRA